MLNSRCGTLDRLAKIDQLHKLVATRFRPDTLAFRDVSKVTIRLGSNYSAKYNADADPVSHVTCPLKQCDKTYANNEMLLGHIRDIHTGYRVCYICYTVVLLDRSYKQHMLSHLRPYQCKICNTLKTCFTSQKRYEKHVADNHTKTEHFCERCGKTYATMRSLLLHSSRVHNVVQGDSSNETLRCNKCKAIFVRNQGCYLKHNCENLSHSIICKICGKLINRNYYSTHIKMHDGAKSSECTVCGKKFLTKSQLRYHMVSHTGERRYKCDVCGKTYTQSHSLKAHQRLHTGERPYKCDLCKSGFISSDALKLHKKSKHKVLM